MSDNIRTRIAAVICGMDALHAEQWSLDVADAVIRELKLEKQTLNREMWAAAPNVCRYVTEWEPDDE